MGRDIHAFICDGRRDIAKLSVSRDYYLFDLLTGGRGFVAGPRGLGRPSPDVEAFHFSMPGPYNEFMGRVLNAGRYKQWEFDEVHQRHDGVLVPVAIPARGKSIFTSISDFHSRSWLTLPELERVAEVYRETPDYGSYTAAWVAGQKPDRDRFGWRFWRSYPVGNGPHLEPIPWWENDLIPGPVITDMNELVYVSQVLHQSQLALAAELIRKNGSVTLQRWGKNNGVLGPNRDIEGALGMMRALQDPRFVFSFDN